MKNTRSELQFDTTAPARAGIALPVTMMVMLAVTALNTGALMMGANHILVSRYYERESLLGDAARAGVELARAKLNGDPSLYPDSGYTALESSAPVLDVSGSPIPGVHRWLYAGPTGVTSGQYGVFGSILAVVRDGGGGVAVRRLQVFQESFAKYAYFTDVEPSNISFGGGDQIFGPVHTNDYLKIYSSGATFHSSTRTAKTVNGAAYGTFVQGYEEGVAPIAMPQTADLLKLQTQAAMGNTTFVGNGLGGAGEATLRIEFIAVDLNGDGQTTGDDEGFMRVYRSDDSKWVVGYVPSAGMRSSENCGHYHADESFVVAADHPWGGLDSWQVSLSSAGKRCYLGGADSISGGFVADDGVGEWVPWTGPVSPLLAGRPDAGYLFPITRALNPSFKGVVFVDGKVAISGTLRGRVTVAATNDIIVADDIRYATDPGLGTCVDILGMFSGDDVTVSNNTLNAPTRPASGMSYYTYDDTKDEFIHGVALPLDQFKVDGYSSGSRQAQPCEGKVHGRGCLYLTGGIIQRTRGAVGTIWSVGGTGYVKRYAYDPCAATQPPPYFPTTGHFNRGQYYEVDPVGFSVDQYYALLSPGG